MNAHLHVLPVALGSESLGLLGITFMSGRLDDDAHSTSSMPWPALAGPRPESSQTGKGGGTERADRTLVRPGSVIMFTRRCRSDIKRESSVQLSYRTRDQRMSFRKRWSSSTSSRIAPGSWSRCQRGFQRPANVASAPGRRPGTL